MMQTKTKTIKNASFHYYCEFDLDEEEISVVMVVRSEDGGSIELTYTDLQSMQYAAMMLEDAKNALEILQAVGFHEGIEILDFSTDEPEPMTIENLFGSDE